MFLARILYFDTDPRGLNGLELIARAHQLVQEGYKWAEDFFLSYLWQVHVRGPAARGQERAIGDGLAAASGPCKV